MVTIIAITLAENLRELIKKLITSLGRWLVRIAFPNAWYDSNSYQMQR